MYYSYPLITEIISTMIQFQISLDFSITVLPIQHFSDRLFTRNQAFWASYTIKTAHHNIYYCGDGGYNAHFKSSNKTTNTWWNPLLP